MSELEDRDGCFRNEEDIEPNPLPRRSTILTGVLLAPVALVCVFSSATLIVDHNIPATLTSKIIGTEFLLVSLWVFYLSMRLIFSKPKSSKKFLSPRSRHVVALIFIAMPLVALVASSFWEKPVIYSIMIFSYIFILCSAVFTKYE